MNQIETLNARKKFLNILSQAIYKIKIFRQHFSESKFRMQENEDSDELLNQIFNS